MKKRIFLFVTGCFTLLLSSCLGSDDNVEYDIAKNCQISSFTLKHDSIPSLSKTKFTIDQISGLIYNQDSLPYGTVVEKVVATVGYMSQIAIGSVQVTQEAQGDSTVYWNGNDSLDYSKPVKIIVTAYDGITKKMYDTRLNVHQVNPDTMVWSLRASLPGTAVTERKVVPFVKDGAELYYMYTKEADGYHLYTSSPSAPENWTTETLAGLPDGTAKLDQITEYENKLYIPSADQKLYRSADGLSWEVVENTPAVLSLLGVVHEETTTKRPSALAVIASVEGESRFAGMDKDGVWLQGEKIHDRFPVSGFSPLSYNLMFRERLMLAGGKAADGKAVPVVWSTMDGISWVSLTNDAAFGARHGASVAMYDTTFFMVGGQDGEGKMLKDIYRSKDHGITWALSDTLVVMPDEYKARAFASMLVDDKTDFIYLFGGKEKTNTNDLGELWRGRINRLGFKK